MARINTKDETGSGDKPSMDRDVSQDFATKEEARLWARDQSIRLNNIKITRHLNRWLVVGEFIPQEGEDIPYVEHHED